VRTDDTRHRPEHPDLTPGLPVLELVTTFRVLAALKSDAGAGTLPPVEIRLH
jgi:hypothetical protein